MTDREPPFGFTGPEITELGRAAIEFVMNARPVEGLDQDLLDRLHTFEIALEAIVEPESDWGRRVKSRDQPFEFTDPEIAELGWAAINFVMPLRANRMEGLSRGLLDLLHTFELALDAVLGRDPDHSDLASRVGVDVL